MQDGKERSTARAGAALALGLSLSLAGCGTSGPAPTAEPGRPLVSDFPAIRLGAFQNEARPGSLRDDRGLDLTGVFSDLYHDPRDGADVFWAVTDRGPTRPTADGKAREFPVPDFDPVLLKVMAAPGTVVVLQQLPILTPAGGSVSGLPNRASAGEAIVGPDAEPLPANPSGLDPRGLVRIADGTFWLADTNGPSLVHLTADARVLERWLPEGAPLSGAAYSTAEVLPAFLGRGAALESLAATAEGRYLFTMTSRPPAADGGRLVRLLELDTLMARPVGEWAYLLDDPEARLSALAFVDAGRLLAVETTGVSARLFELDLRDATNVLNGPLDTAGPGEPRDEAGLEASGVRPVAKSLRVDLAGVPGAEGRIQGVAILNEDTIAVGREEGSALPVLLGGADPSELAAPRLASRLVTLRLDAPLPLGR